jgi:hypothetical protein
MNKLSLEIKTLKRFWIIQQIGTSLIFLMFYLFLKINIGKILIPILTYQDYLNIGLILPVLNTTRGILIYVIAFSFVTMGVVFLYDSLAKWCFKLTEYLAYVNIVFFSAFTVAGIFFTRAIFNERGGVLVHDLNVYIIIIDVLLLAFGCIMVYTNISSIKLVLSITTNKVDKSTQNIEEIQNLKTDKDINELL